jgi:hypothetical protein
MQLLIVLVYARPHGRYRYFEKKETVDGVECEKWSGNATQGVIPLPDYWAVWYKVAPTANTATIPDAVRPGQETGSGVGDAERIPVKVRLLCCPWVDCQPCFGCSLVDSHLAFAALWSIVTHTAAAKRWKLTFALAALWSSATLFDQLPPLLWLPCFGCSWVA